MEPTPVDALRVSQLDTSELDQELVRLTKSHIAQLFKYHTTAFLTRFDPEIQAGIKLLLWKFALYDSGSTVGQKILGIKYFTKYRDKSWIAITGREKILYGLLVIIFPWLKERLSTLLYYLGLSNVDSTVSWWVQQIETVFKVSAFINLLVFLRQGVYLTLLERLLGIRAKFPQQQGLRQVGFEFMTRELMWHGFSEFLFFLLPLINFQRIKNTLNRWVRGQSSSTKGHLQQRTHTDLTSCAICEDWPVMPREIGCRHVFCYYCIQANFLADPNFTCPLCGHPVVSEDSIQTVKAHINPERNTSS
ncbi:peroxisome biogenesis factor 2-like [Biomphalaria glabrata]|uniref:Peroxisome biogenesis factor 2 n=1 Tax=Biomphalaria glabrata TaxID=6526 RepID=A0A9U8EKT4_BIOGL|nr:peroxisome biogenesis factor 2-like [Biomphalaria glabrata]